MTETRTVSIEEVRTLVAERQRYEDWLTALEAKRAETPVRVFERVQGDYVARRRDVMDRLREHVGGLAAMADDLDARVASLESELGALEDERAEAMLRTAVGEFDSDRWERVRQDVEAKIGHLGEQRTGLLAEVDEVRTLLASARSEPEVVTGMAAAIEPEAPTVEPVVAADAVIAAGADDLFVDGAANDAEAVMSGFDVDADGLIDGIDTDDAFGIVAPFPAADGQVDGLVADGTAGPVVDEMADLDNALSLFGGEAPATPFGAPNGVGAGSPSLNDLDVFDDAELGDLRMAPPARSTATATPPASPSSGAPAPARDGFDDLAFLRSVVDPSASAAVPTGSVSGEQQKTLRCTECGTMNLPTEWYCERCGGELAAF